MTRVLAASRGILNDPLVSGALGMDIQALGGTVLTPDDIVVGWGQKPNTRAARAAAEKAGARYWRLEDGFIGYLSHPVLDPRRVSLIVDETGIYYDASGPSDLERLLKTGEGLTPALVERAEAAMARLRRYGLSKYNHTTGDLSPGVRALLEAKPAVLVIDQTAGDISIAGGLADAATFDTMLDAALAENPDHQIIVKTHPDVLAGRKQGCVAASRDGRVQVIAENCSPQALLAAVDRVYTVSSQMGFEALIAGTRVTTFGVPFYARWGLTDDRHPGSDDLSARRGTRRTLPELFAAACLLYCRYVDPYTGARVALEDVLDLLELPRLIRRPSLKRLHAVGFSIWKRAFLRAFVRDRAATICFPLLAGGVKPAPGDGVLVWGTREFPAAAAGRSDVTRLRMEDGFMRSVGLGSDYRRPASLALDGRGLYYDAGQPSDLEHFLKTHDFTRRETARAGRLLDALRDARISKYNLGGGSIEGLRDEAGGRPLILVPGQVESDASIALGAGRIRTNEALLAAVRAHRPDAFIVYKPHPDVVMKNRAGDGDGRDLGPLADAVVPHADIMNCLDVADEVHVLTSLAGFEALIRHKPVTVYGRPFYAGWGLTDDRAGKDGRAGDEAWLARRGRSLTLDELGFAALIAYPTYVDWPSGRLTSPEALISHLQAARDGERKPGALDTGAVARFRRQVANVFDSIVGRTDG